MKARQVADAGGSDVSKKEDSFEIPYTAPLIGNIRQILTGLQGFGSMALELIQNADDSGAKHVTFNITDASLEVFNDQHFSTCGLATQKCPWESEDGTRKACDFHAISMVGSGNKYRDASVIGRFGIGFVSVYQVTDTPIIHSLQTRMTLDPLHERNTVVRATSVDGTKLELPWALNSESPTRIQLFASPIKPSDFGKVALDIERASRHCLLFLRHLDRIEVSRSGRLVFAVHREKQPQGGLRLIFGPTQEIEEWFVLEADAGREAAALRNNFPALAKLARNTNVRLAFRRNLDPDWAGKLFAYLPTEQDAPIPCHINADFFPEQDRRAIVLTGEQHERHWNQMLLDAAAAAVGRNLLLLRDALGHQTLWQIISMALRKREQIHFANFWKCISASASDAEIVWLSSNVWAAPESTWLLGNEFVPEEEHGLTALGLKIVHASLRPYQNALEALRVKRINLAGLVEALEKQQLNAASGLNALTNGTLHSIRRVVERSIPRDNEMRASNLSLLERLRKVCFLPSSDELLYAAEEMRRLPATVSSDQVVRYLGGIKLVNDSLKSLVGLNLLVPELTFNRLLDELADRIDDSDSATATLSDDPKKLQAFYRFLSSYPRGAASVEINRIENTPFLRAQGRFISPNQAVLPGGFADPVGRFNTLDTTILDDRAREFIRDTLQVPELTLASYIRNQLPAILDDEVSEAEYVSLVDELCKHTDILADDGLVSTLRELSLAWTQADTLVRARDCYVRTSDLVEILGDQPANWFDTSIFPKHRIASLKGFFGQLGMRDRPSLSHIVGRLESVTDSSSPLESREVVSRLFQSIFDTCETEQIYSDHRHYSSEIAWLRGNAWLPASTSSQLDGETWYSPSEIFQPFRSAGFSTQVAVLAVRPNPRRPYTGEFLRFIGIAAEPNTATIVAHLIHCSEAGQPPNELTYQILNERVRSKDGLQHILNLKGRPCIYSANRKAFYGVDRIFWSKPHLHDYCFQAPEQMQTYRDLFDLLGVKEQPDAKTYLGVAKQIAREFGTSAGELPIKEQLVLDFCAKELSKLLEEGDIETSIIEDDLAGDPCVLTMAATLAFPDEVAVRDSDWLAAPFGDELNSVLVSPKAEHSPFFEALNLTSMSRVTRIEAVVLGETVEDPAPGLRIKDRSDLLLWLLPKAKHKTREKVAKAFATIKVLRTDRLQVRSVFSLNEPAIQSAPWGETVFYDAATNQLYLHIDSTENFWTTALKVILSTLLAGDEADDIRQCSLNAKIVLSAESREEAESELLQADFAPIHNDDGAGDYQNESEFGAIGEGASESGADNNSPEGTGSEVDDPDDGYEDRERVGTADRGKPRKDGSPNEGNRVTTSTEGVGAAGNRDGEVGAGTSSAADKPNSSSGAGSRRTQWMRSYVYPRDKGPDSAGSGASGDPDRNASIDAAAIQASVEYEETWARTVERMPHFHPGHDLISKSDKAGERRIIEVKGIDGPWTGRGVKLSRTQIMTAEETGDDYWLYVVEHALEPSLRRVIPIQNPFFKADEFWFDEAWREIADQRLPDPVLQFSPGRQVSVTNWGIGTIISVTKLGVATRMKIDFEIHGTKEVPFNAASMRLTD